MRGWGGRKLCSRVTLEHMPSLTFGVPRLSESRATVYTSRTFLQAVEARSYQSIIKTEMADSNKPETAAATVSLAELKEHLNNLWTHYLTLLDQYDKARKELSSHLSSVSFVYPSIVFHKPDQKTGFLFVSSSKLQVPESHPVRTRLLRRPHASQSISFNYDR